MAPGLVLPGVVPLGNPEGRTNFNFLDPAPLLGGYLFIAISTMHIAAGIFASSLTRSQLVASLLSFGILFIIVLGEYALFPQIEVPKNMAEDWHHADYLSTFRHLEDFSRGILDSRPFILYITSTSVLGGAILMIEQKGQPVMPKTQISPCPTAQGGKLPCAARPARGHIPTSQLPGT